MVKSLLHPEICALLFISWVSYEFASTTPVLTSVHFSFKDWESKMLLAYMILTYSDNFTVKWSS